jgi:hypothetical protein
MNHEFSKFATNLFVVIAAEGHSREENIQQTFMKAINKD